jgi:4-amino-4-deoxy-L-arabinose transferase-like glycosyltransferase
VVRAGVVLLAPLDPDESEHLHATWLTGQGRVPFLDFWDHHAPLFFYLLAPLTWALADRPEIYLAARALMTLAAAGALVLVYRLGRRLSAPAGLAAVVLLAALPRFADQTTEVRPDVPALVTWLLTLLALVRWREAGTRRWLLAAGLALGVTGALNLKAAYGALGLGALVLAGCGAAPRPPGRRLGDVAVLVAAALVVPAAVVGVLWLTGGAPALGATWRELVLGNLRFIDARKELPLSGTTLGFTALALGGLAWARSRTGGGLLGHPLHGVLLVPGATIAGVLLLPTTPGVGIYAWLPVLAPAAVYAGAALVALLDGATAGARGRQGLAAAAVALALVLPAAYSARLALGEDDGQLRRARSLLRHACPGEPVLDGTALAVFRPAAYFQRVFILGIREWIAAGVVPEERVVADIRRTAPRVAVDDRRLRAILQVAALVDAHYVPHPDGILVAGAAVPVPGDPAGGRATVELLAAGPYRLTATTGVVVALDGQPAAPGVMALAAGRHEVTWTGPPGPPGQIRLAALTCPERTR